MYKTLFIAEAEAEANIQGRSLQGLTSIPPLMLWGDGGREPGRPVLLICHYLMQPLYTPNKNLAPRDLLQQSADRRRRAEDVVRAARNAVIERQILNGKFLYSGPDYYLAIADSLTRVDWLDEKALRWLNIAFNVITEKHPTTLLHARQEVAVCAIVAKALKVPVIPTYHYGGVQAPYDGYYETGSGRRFLEVKMLTNSRQYMLSSNEAHFWMRQPVRFYGIVMADNVIIACCTGYTKEPFIYGDDLDIAAVNPDWLDYAARHNW